MLSYRNSEGAAPDEAAYLATIRLLELDRASTEQWLVQGLRSTSVNDGWQFICALSYVCFYLGSLDLDTIEFLMDICAEPAYGPDARCYAGRALC